MPIRRLPLVLVLLIFTVATHAQNLTTSNAFVSAAVQPSTGWLGISAPGHPLSNANHSYLSLIIDGKYYTNNNSGPGLITQTLGGAASVHSPDVSLLGGASIKRGDTIITDWNEGTFDIQQRVYPVAFRASGQIVLSVRIVNHGTSPMSVMGSQYIVDLRLDNVDAPSVVERNAYDGAKTHVPSPGSASLYAAFFSTFTNLSSAGFTNDSFPPAHMGLTPCSAFAIVDWPNASGFTYGIDGTAAGSTTLDNAALMQWPSKSVPGASLNDSTTVELFRTSYGTEEFCKCFGNAVAINVYPTAQKYSFASRTYSPNPLPVLSLVFNAQSSAISNLRVTHSVTSPMRVVSGGTVAQNGLSATYHLASLAPNDMHDFLWRDSTASGADGNYAMDFNLTGQGYSGSWDCLQPRVQSGCDVKVDTSFPILVGAPTVHVLSRTGSYDGSDCNARQITLRAFDTGSRHSTVSVTAEVAQNMRVLVPPTKQATDTIVYDVDVIDSMLDGLTVVAIRDTIGNTIRDTVRYCTIPDSHAPTFVVSHPTKFVAQIDLTDSLAWDRGLLKSFQLVGAPQLVLTTDGVCSIPSCCKTFRIFVRLADSSQTGVFKASIIAIDCGNQRVTVPIVIDNSQSLVGSGHFGISIYPNPITADLFIQLPDDAPQSVTVQDMLGRTVAQFVVTASAKCDFSTLPNGTYVVRVGAEVRRIVKSN
jgi:hypothetical protein